MLCVSETFNRLRFKTFKVETFEMINNFNSQLLTLNS